MTLKGAEDHVSKYVLSFAFSVVFWNLIGFNKLKNVMGFTDIFNAISRFFYTQATLSSIRYDFNA